jgi:phosphate transport system protein
VIIMRSRFDEQLNHLRRKMIEMGAECENMIALSTNALFEGNLEDARKAKDEGRKIDDLEREIESICLKLLLQQQPVAKDLRVISAALKMITDMERIGDQAEDIAEIVASLDGRVGDECIYISLMAEATIKMVTESIDAYVNEDLELAKAVLKHDDLVDEAFVRVKERLIKMISENIADGEYALDLLMIAKYFERIGDHATNIAEWVIFSVTGIHLQGE